MNALTSYCVITGRIATKRQTAGNVFTQWPKMSIFAPQWVTRCTDSREIWHDPEALGRPRGTWVRLAVRNFTSIDARGGYAAPKVENFHLSVKNGPAGVNPWTDFYKC